MLTLTTYTAYASVRSILGVDSDELTDVELAQEYYALSLKKELYAVTPSTDVGGTGSLFTKFSVVALILEGSRTADQQSLYDLTRLLSSFFVARSVLPGLSMRAKKSETDGKAAKSRFSSEVVFRDVKADVEKTIASLMIELNKLGVTSDAVGGQLLGLVSPSVDIIAESIR